MLIDVFKADGTQGSDGIWPCDNGDCTEWDNFLRQVVTDLKANNMIEGLEIDLWNEADSSGFWAKSRSQYLQTYNWAYHRLRELLPGTLLVGPSTSQQPTTGNTFWTDWMSNVIANGSIPDIYSWHLLGGQGGFSNGPQDDAGFSISQLTTIRNTYGAPVRPYQVNEYGPSNFQVCRLYLPPVKVRRKLTRYRIPTMSDGLFQTSRDTTFKVSAQIGDPTLDQGKIYTMGWRSLSTETLPLRHIPLSRSTGCTTITHSSRPDRESQPLLGTLFGSIFTRQSIAPINGLE